MTSLYIVAASARVILSSKTQKGLRKKNDWVRPSVLANGKKIQRERF